MGIAEADAEVVVQPPAICPLHRRHQQLVAHLVLAGSHQAKQHQEEQQPLAKQQQQVAWQRQQAYITDFYARRQQQYRPELPTEVDARHCADCRANQWLTLLSQLQTLVYT